VKLLAFDSSSEHCSAALWLDGEVDARDSHAGQTHSEILLPMVDELLAAGGVALAALDGIAFGAGPGSFTGLRIACGVAQGLAFGAGLRVAGISTLLALAEGSGAERAVCCIDARMSEIYHAAYEKRGGAWQEVHAPSLRAPADVPTLGDGEWTGCGNGFTVYRDVLAQRYRLKAVQSGLFPHARDIVRLAAPLFEQGMAVDAAHAAPIYLRDRVALKTDER
jgi:tRNA threonylcarbamoyladenosine biosynthesis protein TsaB